MQKQAVLVCSVCALAAILTIAITMTLLKRGKTPAAPGEQPSSEVLVPGEEDISDHYQISETSAALLPETADAGESYQKETLFLGDSNTVRLYANGLISLQQFCAKEGIGTHAALNEGIVTFKKDSSTYTIAQAVAKMKPRRVVIMLGTNDNGMSVDEFIKNYTALVQAIQESYPYTDIIVNTVPPVPANHANYPHMDQTKIDDFNMALLSMCEQMGLKFLNSAEALKDANGYGREDYYQTGDIHLKPVGLKAMLSYLRTHAYQTDDRRPERYKLELLMNQADLTVGQREVEKQAHARSESTGGAPAAAIELPDGTVVTGKTGPLLGAAASALMNALKVLAGIPQETDLVSAASIEPIQTLKTNYLGGKNPRLHTDEILIALSSSAASNEQAAAAMHQLPNLKGCDVHSTVLLSGVDTSTLNRLGMYLTCDPVYEEEDRKYHKQ